MSHRVRTGLVVALLLAATRVQAVPPRPEILANPADAAVRSLFIPEPFSVRPPDELRTLISDRMAAGATVHLNMVVVLVDFQDRPADTLNYPPAHFDSLLFRRGVYPTGSMADYYYENSRGRLILGGVVLGWYRMPQLYSNYVAGLAGRGFYPTNSQGLAETAIKVADPDVNFALFDDDGPDGVPDTIDDDEIVDLLMVVHAGAGGESATSRYNLQSVAWWLVEPQRVDGVFALNFAICPELGTLGVFAHETGHLLGLPDLYDLTGGSFGLGTWSLMAGGWSLNEGRTPVNLDPFCRQRLGFINPVNVSTTLDDAIVDPIETGGSVYRLAPGGVFGTEYFLVENRQKIGFDAFLPGGGLLVYHVDEMAPTNNIPTRYMVGLEQADGLYQLENFFGSPSFGDAGDPYTEATPSGGFGRFTVPDSRYHSGMETGVTVYHIRGPDAANGDRMRADFRAVGGPTIRFDSLEVVPVTGNGDRFIEAGETFDVRPSLKVQGGTAHQVLLELATSDPLAILETPTLSLGDLAAGVHADAGSLRVRIGTPVPNDPHGLDMTLKVSYREEIPIPRSLTVAVGTVEGMRAEFDPDAGGFTHQAFRFGFYDLWRQEGSGGTGGSRAWHCGNSTGGFRGDTDAVLLSPLFIIPPDAVLEFDQLVEIPPDDSGDVVAGGFVEVSVNGSDWTQIAPTRGYDRRYFSGDPDLNGRYIFTGDAPGSPVWEKVVFPLGNYAGGAVARFHFFSITTLFQGKGWWIDNVQVRSATTPVRLAEFSATRVPEGVRLEWALAGADPLSRLQLGRAPAGCVAFEPLAAHLLPAAERGSFTDAGAAPGTGYVYRLEAVLRTGARVRLGQIEAPPSAVAPPGTRLAVFPNPTRGSSVLELALGREGPVQVEIFDAAGRMVRRLLDAPLPAGTHQVRWDGTDDGGAAVPGGIYFYRLRAGGETRTRKLVLVP